MKTIDARFGLVLLVGMTASLASCKSTLSQTTPDGSGPPVTDGGKRDAPLGPPLNHRAQSMACDSADSGIVASDAAVSQDSGLNPTGPDGGLLSCLADSDCPACASGQLDRCVTWESVCTCDLCNTDENCGATGVCSCNGQSRGYSGRSIGNVCVPSNCRVDTDCGPAGFCSPTVDFTCGGFYGLAGYYCHTANDQCTNDSDCTQGDCRYSPQIGYWLCGTGFCAG